MRQLTQLACLACLVPSLANAQPLQLWHAYGGAEEEALREATRAWEAETGEHVELLSVAFGAYLAKLQSAIPTGRGPDVFIDAHERLATYVAADLIRPIDTTLDLDASSVAALRYGPQDQSWGVPLSLKCAALYINTDLVQVPGVLPDLWSAPIDGVTPLAMEAENAYYVAALLHANGGALFEDGTYAFEGDAAETTVRMLREWIDAGIIPEEANGELVARMFRSGHAAAAISGPWFAPDLPSDLNWKVIPLPWLERGGGRLRPFVTVEAAFVSRDADARAESLARFLADRRAASIRARTGRQVVTLRPIWDELADDEFLTTFRRAANAGMVMPTHPRMRQVFEPAMRALRKVLRGNEDIRDSLRAGALTYADDTRDQPAPTSPTPYLIAFGLLLLAIVLRWVSRMRDPAMRTAIRESMPAYRYLVHAFIAVALLVVLPLAVGAATSLFAGSGRELHFAGLANYVDILGARGGDLFGHRSFYLVLLVTVLWTVLNLALHVGIGVGLALLLNRDGLRFRGTYRVLLILPWAVPNYVTALAWKGMFHRQFGAINAMLEFVGVDRVSWFGQWSTAFAANISTNVWLGFPFMMVVTLGALSAIPKDLYEAAAVDGATPRQRFRHVTWPMIASSLAPAVAMGAVWTFNMFNVVFLVSAGEPDGSTEILVSEAYRWAFTRGNQYGYAAAYAVLIFGVLLVGTRLFGRKLSRGDA